MTSATRRRVALGLIGAVFAALWGFVVAGPHVAGRAGPADRLEATLTDLRFRTFGALNPDGNVVIVAIDDMTLSDAIVSRQDSRMRLAALIGAIADQKPRAIGLDVILAGPGDVATDDALAAALSRVPTVIAAAGSFATGPQRAGPPETRDVLWPDPVFSSAAEVGLVNLATDLSGTPRYVPLLFVTEAGLKPSLALTLATLFNGADPVFSADRLTLGARTVPLDFGLQMPLRLIGPAATIPTVSAIGLLDGRSGSNLAGKIVILGYTATGTGDRFPTPFDQDTPGVEIIATAVNQLLDGPTMRRDARSRLLDAATAVLLAAGAAAAVLLLPLSSGVPLAAAAVSACVVTTWLAFPFGLWMNAALPLLASLPPVTVAVVFRYFVERQQATRSRRAMLALRQFQSPALVEMIAEDPGFLNTPRTQDLVVFFVDLSGFTRLSQRLGPLETQNFLKMFHTRLTRDIERRNGIVFNYMGDGAMAVFGIVPQSGHAPDDAVEAAFDVVSDVGGMILDPASDERLQCRIGIHLGPVALSRLGGEHQQQVSVTGDSVNLASRLMEVAKTEASCLAVSTEVLRAMLGPPRRPPDLVTKVPVRGREGDVEVHLWRR